jgi:uncharacterized protein YoxC
MDVIVIAISIILFLAVTMVVLTVYGMFVDKDKDGIPDELEDKFKELKEQIKNLKK